MSTESDRYARTHEQLTKQQEEDAAALQEALEQLALESDDGDQSMTKEELEEALGKRLGEKVGEGVFRTVYEIADDPNTVAKIDKTWVDPQAQEMEMDINGILHGLFPEHFPETKETLQLAKGNKKMSGTLTQRIHFAPKGTKPTSRLSDIAIILNDEEELDFPRFLDSNIGNGLQDERTGTKDANLIDIRTKAEVYVDDSGNLTPSEILKRKDKIEAFVDRNSGAGKRYTPDAQTDIKGKLTALQNKYRSPKTIFTTAA